MKVLPLRELDHWRLSHLHNNRINPYYYVKFIACYSTLLHHSTPLALGCIVHCIALHSLTARFPSTALKTAVSSVESMVSWVGTCPNQQLGTCLNQLWRVEFCSVESLTFSWWWTWFCDLLIGSNFQTRHLLLQISVSVSLFLIPLSLLPQKHYMPLH